MIQKEKKIKSEKRDISLSYQEQSSSYPQIPVFHVSNKKIQANWHGYLKLAHKIKDLKE